MAKVIIINRCADCPFLGHSGAFTPGGAKAICDHDNVVDWIRKEKPYEKHPYDWSHRQVNINKIPRWCKLQNYQEIKQKSPWQRRKMNDVEPSPYLEALK